MLLEYEPAEESDINTIFSLNQALIYTYEDRSSIDYDNVIAWVQKKIKRCIDKYVRIIADGQKAGYYHFYMSNGVMELDDLYVFPIFQNRGIGTAVIQNCCSKTLLPIQLCVFSKNRRAVALYERLGFNIVREVSHTRYLMQRNSV